MSTPLDLTGQRFGKLTVLGKSGSNGRSTMFMCICDCGESRTLVGSEIKRGHHKSCGCGMGKPQTTKQYKDHPLYDVWKGMRSRCNNKNHKSYNSYGGSGVKICNEWNNFISFYDWAIKNGWREGLQIDKDTIPKKMGVANKMYSPEMCCFLTPSDNAKVRSNVKINQDIANSIRVSGKSNKALSKIFSLHPSTIAKIKNNKKWVTL